MYGKFFKSAFTGSMMASGADVFAVWAYVIAHADKARVELNPNMLAAVIGAPADRMQAAVDVLCAPDAGSRSKSEDGRRLVREGQFQYFVVNHEHYRLIRNEEERREYNREAKRREREREKASNAESLTVNDMSAVSAHTEAEAESLIPFPPTSGKVGPLPPKARQAAPPPLAFNGTNETAINPKALVRIAPDFELPEDWGNDAVALGFTVSETLTEAERYRQYWTVGKGKGKRRSLTGWRQSWSTWLGKAAKDKT